MIQGWHCIKKLDSSHCQGTKGPGWSPIKITWTKHSLTLYTLTSVCIFSILFSVYFLRCWQGEFVQQLRAYIISDHLIYSCRIYGLFRGDIMMLVTLRGCTVKYILHDLLSVGIPVRWLSIRKTCICVWLQLPMEF